MSEARLPKFNSPFLEKYLQMVEDTESPRLYHVWAALTGLGACLGRRVYLPFGASEVYANQYVLLVGNPATRKSTAMNNVRRLLDDSTHLRFSQDDTAGQRKGLIKSMGVEIKSEMINGVELAAKDNTFAALSLDQIASADNSESEDLNVDPKDKHTLVVTSSEFSSFIGQNNVQMLTFLLKMWDGEDYKYGTGAESITLTNPLLNILGCTTPTSISSDMPSAAGGQGFLSRLILVYGARKYKSVPRPKHPPGDKVAEIKSVFSTAFTELHGAVTETPEARSYSEELYDYVLEITDSRFAYYRERRYTHLLKLAIVMAASRGSMEIAYDDYNEAHRILRATERGMPDALGEFGLSPLAMVKQRILEFCQGLDQPVSTSILRQAFHRDAKAQDIIEAVMDLVNANQLISYENKDVNNTEILVSAKRGKDDAEDSILNLLTE